MMNNGYGHVLDGVAPQADKLLLNPDMVNKAVGVALVAFGAAVDAAHYSGTDRQGMLIAAALHGVALALMGEDELHCDCPGCAAWVRRAAFHVACQLDVQYEDVGPRAAKACPVPPNPATGDGDDGDDASRL